MGLNIVVGAALGSAYSKTVKQAGSAAQKLGDQWDATNAKLAATGDVIKYKKKLDELKKKQAALGRSSSKLDAGIAAVQQRYRAAKRAAKGYGVEINRVGQAHERLQRKLKQTERQQARLNAKNRAASKLSGMKVRALGLIGAAYGATRVAGQAMDREEQGVFLKTVINARDGDRQAAVGRALKHARSFARGSLASDAEILQIEYALNSAGLNEDVARAGSELVHRLAKITKGSAEQVGEIVGVTFNNMGSSMVGSAQEKMTQIGNILAKTQFKYQIRDFGQLGESMKFAAATAASAKIPLAQTAAMIGQLNSAGLQGSMAGTAFSGVMRNMTKASEELGFEVVRDQNGMLDMVATLEGLNTAVDGMGIDAKSDLFQRLFGDEGKRAIVPLLDKLPELRAGIAELQAVANGTLVADTYKDFLKTSGGQWRMFKQNIIQVGEVFAGTLLPALNAVFKPMAAVAGWVASSIETYPMIGTIIAGVAVGLGLYAAGVGLATTAQWAFNAAMLANPIGLVVAGVVAGAALIYSNWDAITGWIGDALDAIVDKVAWIGDAWDSIFGDNDKKAVATLTTNTTTQPVPAATRRDFGEARLVAATQAARQDSITDNSRTTIHVSQQPGEDGEALARRITDIQERNRASDQRSRLYD